MSNYFNNTSLLNIIKKWKWHLLVVTILGAITGTIFSGSAFVTPLYRSTAIVYPINLIIYSDENETEQMLQIMNSNYIMDSVVKKNNLLEHYNISKTYPYWKTALVREYSEKIKITRTPYDAVSISVMDKDPQKAYDICTDIIYYFNQKGNNTNKNRRKEAVALYQRQLTRKAAEIDSLRNKLSELSTQYGVIDYAAQSREVTKSYLNNTNNKAAKEMKANVELYGPEVVKLVALIEEDVAIYAEEKLKYDHELRFYLSDLSYCDVISEPYVADRKAFPIRWIVVSLAALSCLFIGFITVILIERKKNRE